MTRYFDVIEVMTGMTAFRNPDDDRIEHDGRVDDDDDPHEQPDLAEVDAELRRADAACGRFGGIRQ